MRLFDTHAHMASELFEADLDRVLERMRENGVAGCMVSCDPGDPEPDHLRALELAAQVPEFCLSVACHPQNALHYTAETEQTVRRIAGLPCCRCIGETGLDYYDNRSTREQQLSVLERHMDIALEFGLPVQLHVRNAHGDMIDVLRRRQREGRLPRAVIVHCFTRNYELAKAYLRLGCHISIGGPVSYTNANKLLETVRRLPADRLLIETDAPWVSPEPCRGMRCEPAFIVHSFRRIAELRGDDPEALAAAIWENSVRILGG